MSITHAQSEIVVEIILILGIHLGRIEILTLILLIPINDFSLLVFLIFYESPQISTKYLACILLDLLGDIWVYSVVNDFKMFLMVCCFDYIIIDISIHQCDIPSRDFLFVFILPDVHRSTVYMYRSLITLKTHNHPFQLNLSIISFLPFRDFKTHIFRSFPCVLCIFFFSILFMLWFLFSCDAVLTFSVDHLSSPLMLSSSLSVCQSVCKLFWGNTVSFPWKFAYLLLFHCISNLTTSECAEMYPWV